MHCEMTNIWEILLLGHKNLNLENKVATLCPIQEKKHPPHSSAMLIWVMLSEALPSPHIWWGREEYIVKGGKLSYLEKYAF